MFLKILNPILPGLTSRLFFFFFSVTLIFLLILLSVLHCLNFLCLEQALPSGGASSPSLHIIRIWGVFPPVFPDMLQDLGDILNNFYFYVLKTYMHMAKQERIQWKAFHRTLTPMFSSPETNYLVVINPVLETDYMGSNHTQQLLAM